MPVPAIQPFFDAATNTISYLVADPASSVAAVIDPALDYDHRSGTVSTHSAAAIAEAAEVAGWRIVWALETHAHADHLSAAQWFARRGAHTGIGAGIAHVQRTFRALFDVDDVSDDGREFDRLLADGDHVALGTLDIEVLHVPGHTPSCVAYRIGDALFVGDTLFMPDAGSARCDFPGGDARTLYRSIRRLLALPEATRIFHCHDYKAAGRDVHAWESTVGEQRARNLHVRDGIDEDAFVALREARDATLPAPALLLPSLQVNIRAGRLPPPSANGVRYLKIPLSGDGA